MAKFLQVEVIDYYGDNSQGDNIIVKIGENETTLFGVTNEEPKAYKMCVPNDDCIRIVYEFGYYLEETGFRVALIDGSTSTVLVDYYEEFALEEFLTVLYTDDEIEEGGSYMRHEFYNSCSRAREFEKFSDSTKNERYEKRRNMPQSVIKSQK